jgi:hypothetical protein
MNSRFGFGRILAGLLAIGLAVFGFRYAMTQAIETMIASQPPPAKLAAAPSFDVSGCDLGLGGFGAPAYGSPDYRSASRPCNFDAPSPAARPAPIQTMSKADSETASLWFMLAGFGLPLALGGAAVAFFMARD